MKIRAKQLISLFMVMIMILCAVPVTASAEDLPTSGTCGENLTWAYDTETKTLTISGVGDMEYFGAMGGSDPEWNVYSDEIKNIVIEDGVTSIGARAFQDYWGAYKQIESIVIPDSVTFISYDCFNLHHLDESEWWENSALYIGNHLMKVKETATGEFVIKEGTVSIASDAFDGCTEITSVIIPDTVIGLGLNIFADTDKLESIHIPQSVSVIQSTSLYGGKGLKKFTVDENNAILSADEHGVLFNKDKTKLVRYPQGIEATSYTMPNTVKTIASRAFSGVRKINEVIFSEALETIEMYAFYNCSITKADFPNSLKTIEEYAFELSDITGKLVLPDSLETIGAYAFSNCDKIESLDTGNGLKVITGCAFSGCSELYDINIGSNVTDIEKHAFEYTKTKDIYIPPTVVYVTADSLGSVRTLYVVSNSTAGKMWVYSPTKKVYVDKITSLKLNAATINWNIGKSGYFKATIEPAMALNKTLSWTSSNSDVATISSTGKLTAVGAGTCVITCATTDGSNLKAMCRVTVTVPNPVTSVKLNTASLNWGIGKTGRFTATVAPDNAADKSLVWSSTDSSVATIDQTGKITAVGVGSAVITCKAADGSGKYAVCKVTVKDMATSLKLNCATIKWPVGKSASFKATVAPEKHAGQKLSWTSSNPKVATVSSTGKLTAVSVGTTTITCKTTDGSNLKATCKVTVGKQVSSVKLNCKTINWPVGKSGSFKATVSPTDAVNKTLSWTSSNPKVATISSTGKLTAVGAGTTTITCKATDGSGKYATCKVSVYAVKITKVTLNAKSILWEVGKSGYFKATVEPSNATNKTLKWVSLNPEVATVSSTGKLTAVAAGTAKIVCKSTDGSGRAAVCNVMVTESGKPTNYTELFKTYFRDGTYAINGTADYVDEYGDYVYSTDIQLGVTATGCYMYEKMQDNSMKTFSGPDGTYIILNDLKLSDSLTYSEAKQLGLPLNYFYVEKDYYIKVDSTALDSVLLENLTYKSTASEKINGVTYTKEIFDCFTDEAEVIFYFNKGKLCYIDWKTNEMELYYNITGIQGTFKLSDYKVPSGCVELTGNIWDCLL